MAERSREDRGSRREPLSETVRRPPRRIEVQLQTFTTEFPARGGGFFATFVAPAGEFGSRDDESSDEQDIEREQDTHR